jgi:prophage antirepressor-like protein
MQMGDQELTVSLFEQFPIRRTWYKDEWWYCCVDCMAALSASPNSQRYWSDFKRDIKKLEKVDVYKDLGVQKLPMLDSVGRAQKTDCANMQTVLRLIQSVKSQNAEPFKQWLSKLGATAMEDTEERALRTAYRLQLHQFDAMLHELVTFRGIVTAEQHEQLDEANYQGLYERESRMALVIYRNLPITALPTGVGMEGFMGPEELATNIFHRAQTAARIKDHGSTGEQIYDDAQDVGTEIRRTLDRLGRPMPEDMPNYPMLRRTEWLPEEDFQVMKQLQWASDEEEPGEEYSVIQIIEVKKEGEEEKE